MTDKNPYDSSIDWLAPQYPTNRQEALPYQQASPHYYQYQQPGPAPTQPATYYQYQQPGPVPTQPATKKAAPAKQARMPKQRALELVSSLKKGVVISSVVSFALIGLLTTSHVVGTTTSNTNTSTQVTNSNSDSGNSDDSGSSSSSTTPSNSSSSNSSNSSSGTSSSSTSQGGFSFGSSSSQSTVSGTRVS